MAPFDFSPYSFLIVDDVRLCRLNVTGVLKTLGSKNIHHAVNGHEAVTILEEAAVKVDCVISDFIMPGMNGLQLLKAIRAGLENTRRDLPVAMLTGHGDESLVGLALKLDVNAFLLKPAARSSLAPRMEIILRQDQGEKEWLKSSEFYARIHVDIDLEKLKEEKNSPAQDAIKTAKPQSSNPVLYSIENVPENVVLAKDIFTNKNRLLYQGGTVLKSHDISRLMGLKEIQFWDGDIWVETNVIHSDTASLFPSPSRDSEIEINPFATSSTEGGFKSTLAQYGALSMGESTKCSRCGGSFEPDAKTIRLHNRGELVSLYCDFCNERDMKLLCACVKFMVIKGGFPLKANEFVEAFYERDPLFTTQKKEDPFESLRISFADDPLAKNDLMYWVHAHYFTMNKNSEKLECMIDRIMAEPNRVKLLGTYGLDAKRMASKRALLRNYSV